MDCLSISVIQTNLVWENVDENLLHFEKKIKSIPHKTHIVVLPEMFTTGFSMNTTGAEDMNGKTMKWMKDMARSEGVILTGSIMVQEKGKYYNRLVWMQPDGVYYTYDKRHLFSYAKEDKAYTAGYRKVVVSVGGWKINLSVCYDLRFPVWLRQQQTNLYDVNLLVANWPSARIAAWDALLKARAIENLAYVVACNRVGQDANGNLYTGHSQVIDPLGNVIAFSDTDEVIMVNLNKSTLHEIREKYNFLKDADSFNIAT